MNEKRQGRLCLAHISPIDSIIITKPEITHRVLMRTYLSESEPLKEGMLIRKWTPKTAESSLLCRLKYS